MPNTIKRCARTSLPTTEGVLFTTGASAQVVVTNILLTNTANAAASATIKFGTVEVLSSVTIPANGVLAIDIKQVLESNEVIYGLASAAGVRVHISGMEVTA
jgi:hypothetical protein